MEDNMKVFNAAGARPNFMKIAPIIEAMRRAGIDQRLIHTGQHYDEGMSEVFFRELGIPSPDAHLGAGSGTHAEQTARAMVAFEKLLSESRPDLVVVVGDVNSTMACTIAAAKMGVPVAHVEAGLRSFDRTMPEEINRVVTDALADLLFTTSRDADENLKREGVDPGRIHFVGNVMIDTLLKHRAEALALDTLSRLNAEPGRYALVTLHRRSNVDDAAVLGGILEALHSISRTMPVIFPMHPRTRQQVAGFGLELAGLRVVEPFGYLDFLNLTANAGLVLTDSGGLQEETAVLGVPCLTLRHNTERPVTIAHGTNVLCGPDRDRILEAAGRVMAGSWRAAGPPELWDGRAAARIVDIVRTFRDKRAG
jgi:UDP-N-acetylglucosamine 2-epimerase (non-hydrolysing)